MHQPAPLVYELLLNQYDGAFTAVLLVFLAVYILVAFMASGTRGKWFCIVLIVGTTVLVTAPFVYRAVVRAYVYLSFGC